MSKKTRHKKPATTTKSIASQPGVQPPSWLAKRPVLSIFGLFFLVMLVFFFETIFTGKTYQSPDAQAPSAISVPLKKALWEEGTFPLWIPYIFGGMPNFSPPFAYFPDAVDEIIGRVIPIRRMLMFALHYVLAGLGVFLFLRRRGVATLPGIVGGLAFMLTPYLITMTIFGHGSQMMTAAYLPLALWAVDRLFERVSLLNIGLAGLIIGLMLQRGHIQIAYYGLMLIGFYLLYHIFVTVRKKEAVRLLPMVGGFVAALALAFSLSAMLLLPLQEYTDYSIRGSASVLQTKAPGDDSGVGFDYATQWSFSPGEMMTFIIPSFYGFGGMTYWGNMPFTDYPNYMGILVLGLAIVALVRRVQLAGFFGITILLALLISFGHNFEFFYRIFYDFFPYFNKFRVPVMILILVQLSVAILAGMGLNALIAPLLGSGRTTEDEATTSRRIWIITGIVLGFLLLLTFAQSLFFDLMRGFYPDQHEASTQLQLDTMRFRMLLKDLWIVGVIAAAGLAMLALAFARKTTPTTAAVVIALLVVLDLWIVDKNIGNDPIPERNSNWFLTEDAVTQFLKSDSSVYRIYPAADLFNELRWAAHGVQSVGGYHAAKPRRYQDFIEAAKLEEGFVRDYYEIVPQQGRSMLRPLPMEQIPTSKRQANQRILDLLNAKYIVSFYPLPEPNWVQRQVVSLVHNGYTRQAIIYENTTVLPRAFLVGSYEVQAGNLAGLRRVQSGEFDPHKTVLLAESPELAVAQDSSAQAVIREYSLHRIVIETESLSPQILVVSDNYYPVGWHAYLDSQTVRTLVANYCFRAVEVPAGRHRIEFRYQSRAFMAGAGISLGALVAAVGLIIAGRRRRAKEE